MNIVSGAVAVGQYQSAKGVQIKVLICLCCVFIIQTIATATGGGVYDDGSDNDDDDDDDDYQDADVDDGEGITAVKDNRQVTKLDVLYFIDFLLSWLSLWYITAQKLCLSVCISMCQLSWQKSQPLHVETCNPAWDLDTYSGQFSDH